ncbi:MAG: Unknown protein [uncultured Sulfurovum sp.]|uniref:Uncharacterized protein n=1 Tax=uncultured Sulfurovum sp. TaxID=269237 RepID=A0A6S6SFA9_9BACT|nr:MAG: Unknown protein [uncultured Sulfurovum sp.]
MCLIVTLIMLVLSIQHFIYGDYLTGALTLFVALGFAFLLLRNIRLTQCDKNGGCDNICMLPSWVTTFFSKKDK